MRNRHGILLVCTLPLLALALMEACGGDSGTTSTDDGGSSDDASTREDGTLIATDSGGGSTDAGGNTDAGNTTDATTDAGYVFDAGTPVWMPDPPTDAGTTTLGDTFSNPDCTFSLSVTSVGGPPTYYLVLHKSDTTANSCNEPKGYKVITTSTNYDPGGHRARVAGERLLAVGYDYKVSLSGSGTVFPGLMQVGWWGGHTLHTASFGLKGADAGGPPPIGKNQTTVTAISFTGHNVTATGAGWFPGAPNDSYTTATWNAFAIDAYQSPSLADTAN